MSWNKNSAHGGLFRRTWNQRMVQTHSAGDGQSLLPASRVFTQSWSSCLRVARGRGCGRWSSREDEEQRGRISSARRVGFILPCSSLTLHPIALSTPSGRYLQPVQYSTRERNTLSGRVRMAQPTFLTVPFPPTVLSSCGKGRCPKALGGPLGPRDREKSGKRGGRSDGNWGENFHRTQFSEVPAFREVETMADIWHCGILLPHPILSLTSFEPGRGSWVGGFSTVPSTVHPQEVFWCQFGTRCVFSRGILEPHIKLNCLMVPFKFRFTLWYPFEVMLHTHVLVRTGRCWNWDSEIVLVSSLYRSNLHLLQS